MSDQPWHEEAAYREVFFERHRLPPYDYQVRLAAMLTRGQNVMLRAPTGSGKTKAVLTPFLVNDLVWPGRPTRLIYALPLRSLVQQVHAEAAGLLTKWQRNPEEATIQTGEQPDDEFFDRGRIIVTTYDQVLSSLLCAPYGLSRRQRNINAAALVGALVVFDEFHLMDLSRAFLTGAAGLRLFRGLTQSVWMTATATAGPTTELARALDCVPLSLDLTESRQLPVVASTARMLRRETKQLTASEVKQHATGRTIVIVNTVDRAQNLYVELATWANESGIPLRCLHARFFNPDRDARIAELQTLFGPGSKNPAILIATQVVEAGVDISCDHLLTELCPMNSLLQRAGRCARFAYEVGTVHVYSFPDGENGHLPYGELKNPAPALATTDAVLREQETWKMSPELVDMWVERVHGKADADALGQIGWQRRFDEVKSRIRASIALGNTDGVSDLIRASDDAQIRAIIAHGGSLPSTPAQREALSISRWSVRRIVSNVGAPTAWFWDLRADEPGWHDLRTNAELLLAYVVCLSPEVASYGSEVGLRLGEPGDTVSPEREPPKRPGYGALRNETWVGHTHAVVRRIEKRWLDEGEGSLTVSGFQESRGLSAEVVALALRVCAQLHDVGKLQEHWQDWATRYQRDRDPSWVVLEPLAHTDYDPENPADRDRSWRIRGRGPHAAASAWYGGATLKPLLATAPSGVQSYVGSACAAAIVAHHGGWIPDIGKPWDVGLLIADWTAWIGQVTGIRPSPDAIRKLNAIRDPRGLMEIMLNVTTTGPGLEKWFALVAYLTRALRLADQKATAEGGEE